MQPIKIFSLERHSGPYEKWPLQTRLFADGNDTGQTVAGFVVEAEYKCKAGYLLITSYDCLFEESNTFTLLNDKFETLTAVDLGAWYETFWLEKHKPTAENSLELDYGDGLIYSLAIWVDILGRPTLKLVNLSRSAGEVRGRR
jgi:hypothetical protein